MKLQQLHKHFLYLIGNKWMRMGICFFSIKTVNNTNILFNVSTFTMQQCITTKV